MRTLRIAVLPGDGIGPEIMAEADKVLSVLGERVGFELEETPADVGGVAIDNHGEALPQSTIDVCTASEAILFGSIGGPKWEHLPPEEQPERAALLPLRKQFGLYANLRPAVIFPALRDASPLRPEVIGESLDLLVVRELTGGIYFGTPKGRDGDRAYDTLPDIQLNHMYVDNAAMQLVRNPRQFDVVLCGNMFGDILSDESAMITGSLGMLPSASLAAAPSGGGSFGLYEPSGGSAPDIAGQGVANPIAQILSAAMMLKYSFGLNSAHDMVFSAISSVLESGYRTRDIASTSGQDTVVSTSEMGDKIAEFIHGRVAHL
ncbi:MAG: 3-isopropylmalate dehydrogenase [Spirochaeta sp.]|nr:3-isopropylmalate dehydrogenase [Spirochaeta sp.]